MFVNKTSAMAPQLYNIETKSNASPEENDFAENFFKRLVTESFSECKLQEEFDTNRLINLRYTELKIFDNKLIKFQKQDTILHRLIRKLHHTKSQVDAIFSTNVDRETEIFTPVIDANPYRETDRMAKTIGAICNLFKTKAREATSIDEKNFYLSFLNARNDDGLTHEELQESLQKAQSTTNFQILELRQSITHQFAHILETPPSFYHSTNEQRSDEDLLVGPKTKADFFTPYLTPPQIKTYEQRLAAQQTLEQPVKPMSSTAMESKYCVPISELEQGLIFYRLADCAIDKGRNNETLLHFAVRTLIDDKSDAKGHRQKIEYMIKELANDQYEHGGKEFLYARNEAGELFYEISGLDQEDKIFFKSVANRIHVTHICKNRLTTDNASKCETMIHSDEEVSEKEVSNGEANEPINVKEFNESGERTPPLHTRQANN